MRSIPSGVTRSWSWVMSADALAPRGAKLGREEELVVVHLDHLLRDELRPLSAQEDAGGEYLLQGEPVHAVQVDEVDRAIERIGELKPAADRERLLTGDGHIHVAFHLAAGAKLPAPRRGRSEGETSPFRP
jgi:hypothetical protein